MGSSGYHCPWLSLWQLQPFRIYYVSVRTPTNHNNYFWLQLEQAHKLQDAQADTLTRWQDEVMPWWTQSGTPTLVPEPYSWCLILILVFCLMSETTTHWLYQLKRVKSRMPVHLKLSSALTQRISKGCLPFPCIRTVALNFYIVINATIIIYDRAYPRS